MSTTIHPFPELIALAEEEARESYSAMREVGIATPYDVHGRKRSEADPWDQLPAGTRDWWISARMSLLCDLTRPASRDAVYRLVSGTLSHEWTPCRVQHAIAGHGLDWRALCARGLVPERYVCGPDEPSGAPASLALIVRHLWPKTA